MVVYIYIHIYIYIYIYIYINYVCIYIYILCMYVCVYAYMYDVCVTWLPRVLSCMLFYKFLHKLHLQEIPSQDFTRRLKESRFGDDFEHAIFL